MKKLGSLSDLVEEFKTIDDLEANKIKKERE